MQLISNKKMILIFAIFAFLSLPGCVSMNAIDHLSNDHEYNIDILDIKQASINIEGDVEVCFSGRAEYRIWRHSAEDLYTFTIKKGVLESSINTNSSKVLITSENIKTGCSTVDGKYLKNLQVSEIKRHDKRDKTITEDSIVYKINAIYRSKIGDYNTFSNIDRYYKIEDARFAGSHQLSFEFKKIKFTGFEDFKFLYPIAFVVDVTTFPFQVWYCLTADYNPCGISM